MIQENINRILMLLGVTSLVTGKSEQNEMAKKAEDSLKENAQAKINQKSTFEEYKTSIYKTDKEE